MNGKCLKCRHHRWHFGDRYCNIFPIIKCIDNSAFEVPTSYQKEITCPYCGNKDFNSEELNPDYKNKMQCEECGKVFIVQQHITVKYSTYKNMGENDAN